MSIGKAERVLIYVSAAVICISSGFFFGRLSQKGSFSVLMSDKNNNAAQYADLSSYKDYFEEEQNLSENCGLDGKVKLKVSPGDKNNTHKVNINRATLLELDELPGIGPSIGRRIIDYREKYGDFIEIEEITAVTGIGDVIFNRIKNLICVE